MNLSEITRKAGLVERQMTRDQVDALIKKHFYSVNEALPTYWSKAVQIPRSLMKEFEGECDRLGKPCYVADYGVAYIASDYFTLWTLLNEA